MTAQLNADLLTLSNKVKQHLARGPILSHQVHPHGGFNKMLAVKITASIGTMWACYIMIAFQFGWMTWQSSGVGLVIHDPYPFAFLLFMSNVVQLPLMSVIMVGQNVLSAHSDARAQSDHDILASVHAQAEAIKALQDQQMTILDQQTRILEAVAASGDRGQVIDLPPPRDA